MGRALRGDFRRRDFLVVALIVKDRQVFDDNWIYACDPQLKVGRIQNFKSWSPAMVLDPALNCYGLGYFCVEGDGLWTAADADLIRLATEELVILGLASREDVRDGPVLRQPKAHPVYDDSYRARAETIRAELEANYPNLHPVGRNRMHKYSNQDHAMMTGRLFARNILAGEREYGVWAVNDDAEYQEDIRKQPGCYRMSATLVSAERLVPARV